MNRLKIAVLALAATGLLVASCGSGASGASSNAVSNKPTESQSVVSGSSTQTGGSQSQQTSAAGARPSGVPAAGTSPAIDRILKQGYIRVGVFAGPPWLTQSTSGGEEWSGPSWSLAQEVSKRLGVPLKLVNVGDDTKVTSVQTGQIDISITPLNETDKRKAVVDFVTYSRDGYCWFSLKTNTKVQSVADLNKPGVVDAEVSGGGPVSTLPQIYPNLKIYQYVAAPGEVYALQPVLTGKADVGGFDNVLVKMIAKQHPDLRFIPDVDECISKPALPVDVGWAIQKGDPVFKSFLDSVAKQMQPELNKEEDAAIAALSS